VIRDLVYSTTDCRMSLNSKAMASSSKLISNASSSKLISNASSSKFNPKASSSKVNPKASSSKLNPKTTSKVDVVKRPRLKVGSFAHRDRAMKDKDEKERKQRIAAIARGRLRDEKASEKAAIKHQKLCDKLNESDEAWYNAAALGCSVAERDLLLRDDPDPTNQDMF
jgi:hypothetical protein